jgi:aspartyl-tRNA(Asn)/glutamyl-tRNA(Gln) amidotransferase subunit C
MARLPREEVRRIARLAALRLSDAEAAAVGAELEAILAYVDQLAGVDTSGVEPTSHVIPFATPLRDDEPTPVLDPEEALAGAPAREGFAFAVPRVVEGEDPG